MSNNNHFPNNSVNLKQAITENLKNKTGSWKRKLHLISRAYISKYPDHNIWFAKKLGKRLSYITGKGSENYLKPKKIPVTEDIFLFIQARELPPEREVRTLCTITRDIISGMEYN